MSINSVTTAVTAQSATATQFTASTSATSSSGSTSESASGSGSSSSGKTVVSEVSITLDGITITTTTYFDGSIEVTKTAASSDASTKGAQTYNAQGVTTNSTSSGGSTAVTSCDFAQRLMSPHLA